MTPARPHLPDSDADAIVHEALRTLKAPARRLFLRRTLTVGGLAMLTGCDLTEQDGVQQALRRISTMNDAAQAWLFDPHRLAPTYPQSMIARPFPFNAYYGVDEVRRVDGDAWRLEVGGKVGDRRAWSLADLARMPQTDQVTRHICVEGWSAIGRWGGVRFSEFLARIGADTGAKYVGFRCADDYHTSIDMPTALHPQTLLATHFDGRPLPPEYGFPVKLRMPTKLGYKNPKHIVALFVTDTYPGGYWEDQGYNWFGGS